MTDESKLRLVRRCRVCNHKMGAKMRCSSCGAWHMTDVDEESKEKGFALEDDGTVLLSNAPDRDVIRYITGPWDSCFGGGVALSSVTLLAGEPGAGKSTMALQLGNAFCERPPLAPKVSNEILYIAAEQGLSDLRPFANRVGVKHLDRFRMIPIGSDANLQEVIETRRPKVVILDSLQGFTNDLNDQAEICKGFKPLCDKYHFPAIIISQVNKGNDIAGLKALEHAVDTTLLFTVLDDYGDIRELRPEKNRYGATTTDTWQYFIMGEHGLESTDAPWVEEEEDEG